MQKVRRRNPVLAEALLLIALLVPLFAAATAIPAPQAEVPPADATQPPMSAPEILERASRRYLEARTYRDLATATTRLTEPGTDRDTSPPEILALETAFVRGGGCLWRFEDRTAGRPRRPFVVWSPDGTQWSSHWALDGQLRRFGPNAAMALAPASGISGGTNALILPLLLGDAVRAVLGRGATDLGAPLLAGREALGGVDCDVVRGLSPFGNDEITLWIDGSGAIRRFERLRTIDPSALAMPAAGADEAALMKPFVARTTVDFQPVFDAEIPAKELDFQPIPAELLAPQAPAAAPADAPRAEHPSGDAAQVLDRARRRHASAKTYRDRVRIASFRGEPGGAVSPQPISRLVAETLLVRDGGCRWSFRKEGDQRPGGGYVVWSPDGKEWSSHWDVRGAVERFGDNAGLAFAGPTGISVGAPLIVLPLLVTRDGAPLLVGSVLDLTEAKLGEPTTIGGVACDVVKGRSIGGGTEVTLWIDAVGVIRKAQQTRLVDASSWPRDDDPEREKVLERLRRAKPWVSVTTYEFEPTFDGPVAPEELDFEPPAAP